MQRIFRYHGLDEIFGEKSTDVLQALGKVKEIWCE